LKKVFALFMCAVMLCAFTACGTISGSEDEKDSENAANELNEEKTSGDKNDSGELPVSGVEGAYKFDEYSDHIVLTEYIGTTPNLYIPDTIKGKPVTEFGTIFKGNLNVRGVLLGKYCTEIVDNAFENCYNLQRLEIVGGVTSIGKRAFFGCHSLKLIYVPECVKTIADDAFLYITDLIIYGDKGSAAEIFAEKYASIYFREYIEGEEVETELITETVTEP